MTIELLKKISRFEREVETLNLVVAESFSSWQDAPEELTAIRNALETGLIKYKRQYFKMQGIEKVIAK